jgi:hypothetical protein
MHSIESMFNTQLATVSAERDTLQTQLLAERDKVLCIPHAM